MTTKTLQALLIGALLSASAAAFADNSIEVSIVAGKQEARFNIGDAKCVLVNDVIKCAPILVAAN